MTRYVLTEPVQPPKPRRFVLALVAEECSWVREPTDEELLNLDPPLMPVGGNTEHLRKLNRDRDELREELDQARRDLQEEIARNEKAEAERDSLRSELEAERKLREEAERERFPNVLADIAARIRAVAPESVAYQALVRVAEKLEEP